MNTIKKETTKVVKTKKVVNEVNYKETLAFNKAFKEDLGSFGAMRSNILKFNENSPVKLHPIIVDLLEKSKIKANYEYIISQVQPNKQGLFSSHKILQFLRSNQAYLQVRFAKAK